MAKSTVKKDVIKISKKTGATPKRVQPNSKVKSSVNVESNLSGAYIETLTLLRDMVDIFAALPDGNRRGIGGDLKLTTKQQKILEVIQNTQERADHLLSLLKEM